jgi:hypothetical protein
MLLDLGRLAKLLGMIGSVHDGESLAAARIAHGMVERAGADWSRLLKQPDVPSAPRARPAEPARPSPATGEEIEAIFDQARRWERARKRSHPSDGARRRAHEAYGRAAALTDPPASDPEAP